MRYWWLGIALLVGTAQAAVYPALLNHETGREFRQMEDLRDVYFEVYDDVRGEPVEEILKRVQERIPEDWGETWSQEFEDLYASGMFEVSTADEAQATLSRSAQSDRQQQLAMMFELEKQFLRLERDLARRSGFEQMFSDGDQGASDAEDGNFPKAELVTSPFDVVMDLNYLDWLLYGEKSTAPNPEYTHRAEEPLREHRDEVFSPIDDEDEWLAQTEDDLSVFAPYTQDSDRVSEDSSVSGTLQAINDLQIRLFTQCPSLAAEMMTDDMFGGTHIAGMLAGGGSSFQMVALPSTLDEASVAVEMRKTEEIEESPLDAILRQLMQQLDPTQLRRNRSMGVSRTVVFENILLNANTIQKMFDRQVVRARRDRERQLDETEGVQFQQGLDSVQAGMLGWFEKMEHWKRLFKKLANKPVK